MDNQQNTPKKSTPKELSLKDWKGLAFKNENPQSPQSPDFKGQMMIEGKRYDVSVWKAIAKNKTEYLSFAISPVKTID